MAGSAARAGYTKDQERWWRAWQLAESDQPDQLRQLAAAGDEHARRELARWLADRAGSSGGPGLLSEAVELIRPLADGGDDVAELWLARWLADSGGTGELRERADAGSVHARQQLAGHLASEGRLGELRERADGGDTDALAALAGALAARDLHSELRQLLQAAGEQTRQQVFAALGGSAGGMPTLRVLADAGHRPSANQLVRRLARDGQQDELRQRAAAGDDYARQWLTEPGD